MKLVILEAFNDLLTEYDRSEKVLIAKTLLKLENSREPLGKILSGKLRGCRSLRTGQNSRLRLVYFLKPPHAIVLAVGQRSGGEVYEIAERILRSLKG